MKSKFSFTVAIILVCLSLIGQQINIIKDLNPGFGTGFLNSSCIFEDDFYFAGIDDGSDFVEVFSFDEDLDISQRVGSPIVRGAEGVFCTDNFIYIYNREAPNVKDIYRSNGNTNNANLLISLDNNLVQAFSFSNGVVIVTEDSQQNKKVSYFSDDSNEESVILSNVNLGQYDFDVTSYKEYIIISPIDDSDYEGGVTIYNSATGLTENNLLAGFCADLRYAYGFENHLVYSCSGDYYVTNLESGNNAVLDIKGNDALRFGANAELFFESDSHIFIFPQEGDGDLFAIDKNDLTSTLVSEKCTSIVNLTSRNGQIYFTEKGSFTDTQLFQLDATLDTENIEITYTESVFRLLKGAVLNNDVHFIIRHSSNFSEHLCSINTDNELINFKELRYEFYRSVLEVIGDNLIFIHNENNLGIELYSLSYEGTSVNDKNVVPLKVFPNPSSDSFTIGVDQSEIVSINVLDIFGRQVDYVLNGNQLSIRQPGLYTLVLNTNSESYTTSLIVTQ